jgi:predicted Fe-Mo cluster-binding NifX family protein
MRIAIPVSDGHLDPHFGHCRYFALVDVEPVDKVITETTMVEAPPHEPGALPAWLTAKGANLILAGGMGSRAIQLFKTEGIEVIVGAPKLDPQSLVMAYFAGEIGDRANACDH